jgi:hypothetical protein
MRRGLVAHPSRSPSLTSQLWRANCWRLCQRARTALEYSPSARGAYVACTPAAAGDQVTAADGVHGAETPAAAFAGGGPQSLKLTIPENPSRIDRVPSVQDAASTVADSSAGFVPPSNAAEPVRLEQEGPQGLSAYGTNSVHSRSLRKALEHCNRRLAAGQLPSYKAAGFLVTGEVLLHTNIAVDKIQAVIRAFLWCSTPVAMRGRDSHLLSGMVDSALGAPGMPSAPRGCLQTSSPDRLARMVNSCLAHLSHAGYADPA